MRNHRHPVAFQIHAIAGQGQGTAGMQCRTWPFWKKKTLSAFAHALRGPSLYFWTIVVYVTRLVRPPHFDNRISTLRSQKYNMNTHTHSVPGRPGLYIPSLSRIMVLFARMSSLIRASGLIWQSYRTVETNMDLSLHSVTVTKSKFEGSHSLTWMAFDNAKKRNTNAGLISVCQTNSHCVWLTQSIRRCY